MSRYPKQDRSPKPPSLARILATVRSWLPATAASAFGAVLVTAEPAGAPIGRAARKPRRPVLQVHAGRADAAAVKRATGTQLRCLARLANGLANRHRLLIVRELFRGPATYEALAAATSLRAGPLYHHVAQLRLAAIIAPKERNLYRLTRGGRALVTILLAALPLARDARALES